MMKRRHVHALGATLFSGGLFWLAAILTGPAALALAGFGLIWLAIAADRAFVK